MPKPFWNITQISDTTEYAENRGLIPAYRIDFETADGTQSHIVVPKSDFNPNRVGQLVQDMASQIISTIQLNSDNYQPDYTAGYGMPSGEEQSSSMSPYNLRGNG